MPEFMFAPRAAGLSATFKNVRKLAGIFRTTLTATSLRLAELGSYPMIIVFSRFSSRLGGDLAQRLWFFKGAGVSSNPNLHWKISDKALANKIQIDDELHEVSGDISADAWFTVSSLDNDLLHEESIRINYNFILTMLSWKQDM